MNLDGKVCVVTGAASGIGQQMCVELARQGATVIAVARDEARAAGAVEEIKKLAGGAGKVEPLACDVSSIASLKKAAAELTARHPKLHLLVNNAAVFAKSRRLSPDGLELGFAVNTLAPFVLSRLLLDALKAGGHSRIVNMTMPTKAPMNFDDLQSEKKYASIGGLQMTKGGSQYLTRGLAKRLAGSDVRVLCVTPGLTQSKLPSEAPFPLRLIFKLFGKTPQRGAVVPLSVCLDDQWKSGQFVDEKGRNAEYPSFIDAAACDRLWNETAKLASLGA